MKYLKQLFSVVLYFSHHDKMRCAFIYPSIYNAVTNANCFKYCCWFSYSKLSFLVDKIPREQLTLWIRQGSDQICIILNQMRYRTSESSISNHICQLSNHVHALSIEIHIKFTMIKSKKVKSISMTLNQFFLCWIPNEMYSNKSISCLK